MINGDFTYSFFSSCQNACWIFEKHSIMKVKINLSSIGRIVSTLLRNLFQYKIPERFVLQVENSSALLNITVKYKTHDICKEAVKIVYSPWSLFLISAGLRKCMKESLKEVHTFWC